MVGIVNRPHTRRITLLRTTTSTAPFQLSLSHAPLFDTSEALGSIVSTLELVETLAFNKLSRDAVWFAAILQQLLFEVQIL